MWQYSKVHVSLASSAAFAWFDAGKTKSYGVINFTVGKYD